MNQRIRTLLFGLTAGVVSSLAIAAPHNERDKENQSGFERPSLQTVSSDDVSRIQNERRLREERGLQRLKQHRWQMGYVMPQHYRGDGYKVEYREYNLPKPNRNQQWYKINNDFILVDADSNNILRIVSF